MSNQILEKVNFWTCEHEYTVSNIAQSFFLESDSCDNVLAGECQVVTGGCPTDSCATGSPCD